MLFVCLGRLLPLYGTTGGTILCGYSIALQVGVGVEVCGFHCFVFHGLERFWRYTMRQVRDFGFSIGDRGGQAYGRVFRGAI